MRKGIHNREREFTNRLRRRLQRQSNRRTNICSNRQTPRRKSKYNGVSECKKVTLLCRRSISLMQILNNPVDFLVDLIVNDVPMAKKIISFLIR